MMDAMTTGIVIVAGVAVVAFYVWYRVEAWRADHPKPVTYPCDPETCEHEWQVESVEDYEVTTGNSSYGGPDPVGVVTGTTLFCPKCGERRYEESDPVERQ